jgi:hypothetical protein
MGWALEVAEKMKIRRAIYWPAAAAILCSLISIPKLLSDGIIDGDGEIIYHKPFSYSVAIS